MARNIRKLIEESGRPPPVGTNRRTLMPVRFMIRVKERHGRKWYLADTIGCPILGGSAQPTYAKDEVDAVVEKFMRDWPERVYRKRATWFGKESSDERDVQYDLGGDGGGA